MMSVISMPYLGLDMRVPKKCVSINYAGGPIQVLYEVADPNKDRFAAGVRMPDSASAQSRLQIEIFPPDGSTIKRTSENHVTKIINDLGGSVGFFTRGKGDVHVCVEILELEGRKYPRPTLVGLRMIESTPPIGLDHPGVTEKQTEQERKLALKHLSETERILMNMIRETNTLLKNAQMVKDDELAFHTKSVEMNAASRWWPILHVIVLLVTGFTQANHVIKFFKGMHII